jgi:putative transcriptional regulator
MAKSKQYRSGVMASVHETAEGLTSAGVMSKQTMRDFDEICLTPVRPLTPEEIRDLREREGASQAVFARYLNVTTGLVSQWERGEKHPQGPSLKLLALVAKNGLNGVA